jgi:hypothetical protein
MSLVRDKQSKDVKEGRRPRKQRRKEQIKERKKRRRKERRNEGRQRRALPLFHHWTKEGR